MGEVPNGPQRRSEAAVAGWLLDKRLLRWLIVLGIAAVALILGYLGLSEYLSHQTVPEFGMGWADILFYDLQLFVLNAAPAEGPGPFPVALGIARFLAPAVTALAPGTTDGHHPAEIMCRHSCAIVTPGSTVISPVSAFHSRIRLRLERHSTTSPPLREASP